jgi:hypothetical protein
MAPMRGVLKPRDERIEQDAYFTPPALADAIVTVLAQLIEIPERVLEPSAGEGVFMDAAARRWPTAAVIGIDLEPRAASVRQGDFLAQLPMPWWRFSLVLGNPPYTLAEDFVHVGLRDAANLGYVAYLLRLSFLGSQRRAERIYSKRNLRWLIPITPRPSFTPDGKTDASEYAVFVWQRDFCGNAELLAPLRWER